MSKVVIIMGSKSDLDHAHKIATRLQAWAVPHVMHVASAHKSVHHLLGLLASYGSSKEPIVYITVAGRSNALGGLVDANTTWPVITCPPISSSFGGADIYSSLRMPSGVAPSVILDPEGAALAATKMLALCDPDLRDKVAQYQSTMTDAIVAADSSLGSSDERKER